MTNSFKFFQSYEPCPVNKKMKTADGSFSHIAWKGSIHIYEKKCLNSISYVPKLDCNLLYVSKLSKESNCSITLYDSHCVFQDKNLGMTIGNTRMIYGLYYFEENLPSGKIAQDFRSICSMSIDEKKIIV